MASSNVDLFISIADQIAQPAADLDVVPIAQDKIKSLIANDDGGLRLADLLRLQRAFTVAALQNKIPARALTAFLGVVDAVRALRFVAPLTEIDKWRAALSLGLVGADRWDIGQNRLTRFSREHAIVDAANRLTSRGYRCELDDRGLILKAEDTLRLCNRLDKLVSGLGGRGVAQRIVHEHLRTERMLDGSFLYGRNVTQVPQPRPPSVPWHYIFQLGMKHLNRERAARRPDQDWRLLVELARDFCATLDAEPYSSLEDLDLSLTGVQDALQRSVLYDEMFSFQQWQPKYAAELVDTWLQSMAQKGQPVAGASTEAWRELAKNLMFHARDGELIETSASQLISSSLSNDAAEATLKLMAPRPIDLNTGYLTPFDTAKRNAPYIPVIRLKSGNLVLPPRALLARALYEWFYARMRNNNPSLPEAPMGIALEEMVEAAVKHTQHSGIIARKKYRVPPSKTEYEVDLLLETPERIFLIECKKKPLTNAARGGNTFNAVVDLSASLLSMIVQISRHERILRSERQLAFLDGTVVRHNGREIEKIAVTMLDHGSLQDRVFMHSLMRALFGAQLTTNASELDLSKVNEILRDLQTELVSLAAATPDKTLSEVFQEFIMSSWWLSVDVLHYLCRESTDLFAALRPIRHLSTRTGDVLTELRNAKIIRGVPPSIPPGTGHFLVDGR